MIQLLLLLSSFIVPLTAQVDIQAQGSSNSVIDQTFSQIVETPTTITVYSRLDVATPTATPTVLPAGGTFTTSKTVTLADATANAIIYYTLDGSTPTPASTVYTAPFVITANTTVSAIAVAAGLSESVMTSATFTIIEDGIGIDLSQGFSNAANLITLNGNAGLNGASLQLTNGTLNQTSSAFYNNLVDIQGFSTDFTFQLSNAMADGLTFTIQRAGLNALGSTGEGLGYGADGYAGRTAIIPNSVAIKFDLLDDRGEGPNSTGLYTNGATPTSPSIDLTGSGINLHSGDPMSVHLTYDGTTLTMTITDTVVNGHFTTSWPINIPVVIGGNTAYLGFTGATGTATADQNIETWTFASTTAVLQVAAPAISVPSGTYALAQTVSFSDATPNAVIHYTLDGSTPTSNSTVFAGPLVIASNTTLKAIAMAPGLIDSPLVAAVYTITDGLRFVPITPCRVADTRSATGPFGGPEMAAKSSRTFAIPQSNCGIPNTAAAYSLNVTVVPDIALGYLSIWPAGQAQPYVSTLNSDGRIKANAAIVGAGTNGGVSVYVSDKSQVVLDLTGYFVPAQTAGSLAFFPVTPCRIADTRSAAGPFGRPSMSAGQSRSFAIPDSSCNIPASAGAYSFNFTVVPHKKLGYLTTWPSGATQPYVSTLNALTGEITANAAIVAAGANGSISAFVTDDSDLIIDINGYFAATGGNGLSLYPTAPCRVLDTRSGSHAFVNGVTVPFAASVCALPASAKAYVTNATVIPETELGFLALWPDGSPQPLVSTLNAFDGATTSNMAIIPSSNGSVDAFATNKTNLVLDTSAFFAP